MIIKTDIIEIDVDKDGTEFTDALPASTTLVGVIKFEDGRAGALVISDSSHQYFVVNDGIALQVDGRRVASALGNAGRPAKFKNGSRRNVYLDEETLQYAIKMGQGNLSEGVRQAIKLAMKSQLPTPEGDGLVKVLC